MGAGPVRAMGRKAEAGGEVEVAREVGEAAAGGELQGSMTNDLTPEWLKGINLTTALEALEYDIGVQVAKLIMLQQRVSDLRAIQKENDDGDNDDGTNSD